MHVELHEQGIHVHISIDERKFPKLNTANLYEEAKGALHKIKLSYVDEVETVDTNGQYL